MFQEQWECRFGSRCNFRHEVRTCEEVMDGKRVRTSLRLNWPEIYLAMTEKSRRESSRLLEVLTRSRD